MKKNKQKVVGRVGFEPTTLALKERYSTTELPSRYAIDSIRLYLAVNSFFQKNSQLDSFLIPLSKFTSYGYTRQLTQMIINSICPSPELFRLKALAANMPD